MEFSRREYWSELPCPPLGDLSDPEIEPTSLTSPALAGGFFTTSATWEAHPNLQESPNFRKWTCSKRLTPTGLLPHHTSSGITGPLQQSSVHLTTFSAFAGVLSFPLCSFPQSHPYFPRITACRNGSRALGLLHKAADAASWAAKILAIKCQTAASTGENHSVKSGDVWGMPHHFFLSFFQHEKRDHSYTHYYR